MARIRIIDTMLQEPVTYWPPVVNAMGEIILDDNQQPTYETPREIKVFWIDKVEEYMSGKGEQRTSESIVFVGVDMIPSWGALLYRARLSSLTQAQKDNPRENLPRIELVQRFDKIPTLKYMQTDQFVRKAYI